MSARVVRVCRWRKSTLSYTMRERLGMDDMIYWDDYSEGLFIGGHNTAYSHHIALPRTAERAATRRACALTW